MRACTLTLLFALTIAGCADAPPRSRVPMGTAPGYLTGLTADAEIPNAQALVDRIYTPALDDGYVPQGLTTAGDDLLVSSYLPTPDLKANTGPCRVFRIAMASGRTTGSFAVPPGTCTHSGGLAYVGKGRLLLADTHALFLIDLDRAFAAGNSAGAMKTVNIGGALRGSYASFDGTDAWIGTWTRDQPQKARMYRLPLILFDRFDGQTVHEDVATASIPVPLSAQGAAFSQEAKQVWISSSNSRFGRLYRLDRATGAVLSEYAMVPGLEDLSVDGKGRLWGVSESGTQKYQHWATRFPFVFRIDTAALQ